LEKTEIKKLDVMSVAKIAGAVGLIWGLIVGIIMALGFGTLGAVAGEGLMTGIGAFGAFIISIIAGAIGGFINGAITAFIYNLAAGWVGGIEFHR